MSEGRPNVIDEIINRRIDFIINTPSGKRGKTEGFLIRRAAVDHNIPYITTISGAYAVVKAIESLRKTGIEGVTVKSIQEYHEEIRNYD